MLYQVKALNGTVFTLLELQAESEQEAYRLLKAKGLQPVSIQVKKNALKNNKDKFPILLFSQELLVLLESGLNLVEAVDTLSLRNDHTKTTLQSLLLSLQEGKPFSQALEQHAHIFPALYIATIKAAEKTGDLSHALTRYIGYEQQISQLKKKVVSASIYPILLMSVGTLVILFLMGFVVPKFSQVYEGSGSELPWMSKLMLEWGALMATHGESFLMALFFLGLALYFVFKQPSVKKYLMQLIWQMPTLGEKLKMYQLARFYRTLGMLLNGGTPIMNALSSVQGLLDKSLTSSMTKAQEYIRQGMPLSYAFKETGMTTPIGERMLLVGERGGNVAQMMERIATFYDEELSRWIDWFTKLFEPILMLFIGLVIGVVVLLLYMPIFELAGQVQ